MVIETTSSGTLFDTIERNKEVVLAFVEAINRGDLDRLAAMMADGFEFVDVLGRRDGVATGMEKRAFWDGYLSAFPAYRIRVRHLLSSGDEIAVIGTTRRSHVPPEIELQSTLAWVARVADGLITHWRIYATEAYALRS
jgi:ketosteroid isomerase-like protein